MRIRSLAKIGAVAAFAAGLVPQALAAQAAAARWDGTFTWDATAKGGTLAINTMPDGWATVALTPTGSKSAIMAEGDMGGGAKGSAMSGGLKGQYSVGDDGKLSVDLPAFKESGCNCTLIGTLEGMVNGNTAS